MKGSALGFRQIAAGAGVDVGAVAQMGGIDAVKLTAGAVAGVEKTPLLQRIKVAVINLRPLTLRRRLPIPVKTQPEKILPKDSGEFCAGALGVQVLHPQYQLSIPGTDRQPGQQRRKYIAKMHPPRGGGGEASHRLYSRHFAHHAAMATIPASSRRASRSSPPIPFRRGSVSSTAAFSSNTSSS